MLYRAPIHATIKHREARLLFGNDVELQIAMHPRVWVDLIQTLKAEESGWIRHTDTQTFFQGMKVVEDGGMFGIDMIVSPVNLSISERGSIRYHESPDG